MIFAKNSEFVVVCLPSPNSADRDVSSRLLLEQSGYFFEIFYLVAVI